MTAPLAAIEACGDDLLRHWGADPAAMVSNADLTQVAQAFGPAAYPPDAQRAGKEGRVRTVTVIDRRGRPGDCRVVDTSGTASLDAAACSIIMRRMQLTPDPGGPEKRYLYVAVRWVLPED